MSTEIYHKDIQTFVLKPGEIQEHRHKAKMAGKVTIRISADNPVTVNIAGPHIEKTEVRGTREFGFTLEPDTEFYIGLQNPKSGFLAKAANATFEIEISGPKKAIDLLNKAKGAVQTISEVPDFYALQKDSIQTLLKESMEVWASLGNESKEVLKELMALAKKFESAS